MADVQVWVAACQPGGVEVCSDRTYRFGVAPDALWDAIGTVEHFESWWPWLRSFDGDALAEGQVWSCVVQPPLPYVLRFGVALEEVIEPRLVRVTVAGDIVGSATLEIRPIDGASEVRLRSALSPRNGLLRVVAAVAWPVVRYGHDWVLDTGARQFRRRAFLT